MNSGSKLDLNKGFPFSCGNFFKKLKGMIEEKYNEIEVDVTKANKIFQKYNVEIDINISNLDIILEKYKNMNMYDNQVIYNFNKSLIDTKKELNIIEYGKLVNQLTNNIDLSFLSNFIELVNNNDFCIDAQKIFEFKIFDNLNRKDKKGNIVGFDSGCFYSNILKKYQENIDFKALEISSALKNQRGIRKLKKYFLTPKCFKKILMRNQKTDKYADYYLFLEELVKYYSDYQILKFKIENEKKDNILFFKDDKIDCLFKKIDNQTLKMDKQSEQISKQTEQNNKQTEQINKQTEKINKLLLEIEKSRQENGIIIDKLDDPGSLI